MFEPPDIDEVIAAARSFHFHLDREDAAIYREHLLGRLGAVARFIEAEPEAEGQTLVTPVRDPGYAPSRAEDPLSAWLWKCKIEGVGDGLLVGKTVSFKDHIPVAGIPLTFGSRHMADFIPNFDAEVVR